MAYYVSNLGGIGLAKASLRSFVVLKCFWGEYELTSHSPLHEK